MKDLLFSVREVGSAFAEVTRNEIILFRTEIQQERETFLKNAAFVGIAAAFAAFGLLAFMSFSIILLGDFLNHKYWLSSLVVGGAFASFALVLGMVGRRRLARLRAQLGVPLTLRMLKQEAEAIDSRVQKFSENWKRRAG